MNHHSFSTPIHTTGHPVALAEASMLPKSLTEKMSLSPLPGVLSRFLQSDRQRASERQTATMVRKGFVLSGYVVIAELITAAILIFFNFV